MKHKLDGHPVLHVTQDEVASALCLRGLRESFNRASKDARGGSWTVLCGMNFLDAMKVLADNGFLFTHQVGVSHQGRMLDAENILLALATLEDPKR